MPFIFNEKANKPVNLPSFLEEIYCLLFDLSKQIIVLLPFLSIFGASAK